MNYRMFFIFLCLNVVFTPQISLQYEVNNIAVLYHEDDPWNSEIAVHTVIQHFNTRYDKKYRMGTRFVSKEDHLSTNITVCDLTYEDEGVIGVIGPSSPQSASLVQGICSKLEIPHIQYHWTPNISVTKQDSVVINFYPDATLLAKGLAVIVNHMKWKGFTVLYEDTDSLVRLSEVLKLAGSTHNPVVVRKLDFGDDYRPLLKEVKNFTENPIILDCSLDRILPFLNHAREVNMLQVFHRYLLVNLDAHTLDFSHLDNNANITTIRLFDPKSPKVFNVMEHFKKVRESNDHDRFSQKFQLTNSKTSYPLKAGALRVQTALLYDATFILIEAFMQIGRDGIKSESLMCDDQKQWKDGFALTSFMRVVSQRSVDEGLSGPISFDFEGRRTNFRLELIEIHEDGAAQVAEWLPNLQNNLSLTRNESAHEKQVAQSLRKGKVIVISKLGMPYLRKKDAKDLDVSDDDHDYEGYAMDIIKEIASNLNFTFEFKITDVYGTYDTTTGSWNGILGELIERRAHLAICDLTITHQRRSLVDFSLPFMNLGVSILYSKAKVQEETNKFAFMEPFDFEVWVYTVSLYFVISTLVYVLCRIAPGDWENPHPCDPNPEELENIWDLKNCFWLTLGSIMTQGCDILPKGISSRMGTSMWWFFSLIMTSSYTANMAAFLTKAAMGTTIYNAEDLAKQTKIKYGTVEGGATQAFFRNSNFSTYQRMWANMIQARPSVFEKSNGEGVRRVNNTKNQLYAFLMESSSIEYEMEKNCNLKQVGGLLDSRSYGIAMPLNSEYRSAIDQTLLKLQERGVLARLKTKWWKEKVVKEVACDEGEDSDASNDALALANVGGVFILVGFGLAIAFVFALTEFLWNVRKVSVEEHISYWTALKLELTFAANVWITKKRVRPDHSESSSSDGSDTKSIAQRVLQGAGSILNLKAFH
ncbi:glutamate receptor ionotropic, kainate 2-like isoform X1 [Onthophagus taurus]|uniref:glutamate receptor ionotropic, kainate 2-like isoform X1 n=1 Tax=Onthophagus taurus TaxID=166361 RepID=UPI0039BE034D